MRLFLMLCLLSGLLAPPLSPARADDPALESEPEIVAPAPTETEPNTAQPADQNESSTEKQRDLKKRKLEIGLILTAGIVVLGVFLVVLTLLYGRRTKRQLSSGRGASPRRDELWYLKHPRETSETDGSEAEREGETE